MPKGLAVQDLYWLRVAQGWSQAEAAQHCQVSVVTYQHWEQGRADPRGANLRRLARAFHVPPERLLVPSGLQRREH
jgi:transcriptional regulator with XRE-family HTH domain